MILWCVAFLCLFFGLKNLNWDNFVFIQFKKTSEALRLAEVHFFHLREVLESGFVPEDSQWQSLQKIPAPWGSSVYELLESIRSEGVAMSLLLHRLQMLAQSHHKRLKEARAKSSSALYQAIICAAMVPLTSILFYFLLPELQNQSSVWVFATCAGILLNIVACVWVFHQAEDARWGGLPQSKRHWMLEALIFCEKLMAYLRAGEVADWAYTRALSSTDLELKKNWINLEREPRIKKNLSDVLISVGPAIRDMIHKNSQNGLPSLEKIEVFTQSLNFEIIAYQERELQTLPQKTLKPLFFAVAPSILGLILFALLISMGEGLTEL